MTTVELAYNAENKEFKIQVLNSLKTWQIYRSMLQSNAEPIRNFVFASVTEDINTTLDDRMHLWRMKLTKLSILINIMHTPDDASSTSDNIAYMRKTDSATYNGLCKKL